MSIIAARNGRSQTGLVAIVVTLLLIYNSFTGSILYRESYLLFVGLTQPFYLALICLWLLRLRRLRQPLPSTVLDTPLLMLGGVILIATPASIAPRLSLNDIPLYFIYVMTYYLVVERLRAGWPASIFLNGLVITAAIVTLLGLLEYIGWYFFGLFSTGQGWWPIGGWRDPLPPRLYRLAHTMFNPNLAGLFLAMVLPIWGTALVSARSGWRRLVLAGLAVANIFVLIATLSRSALLGAILGGLTILFFMIYPTNPNKGAVRLPRWAVLGLFGGTAVAAFLILRYTPLIRSLTRPDSNQMRLELWQNTLRLIADAPLLGTGPETFGIAIMDYWSPAQIFFPFVQAHNLPLHVAAEIGLPGLLLVLVIAFFTVSAGVEQFSRPAETPPLMVAAAVAGLAAFFGQSLADSLIGVPAVMLPVIVLAAICTYKANGGWLSQSRFVHPQAALWLTVIIGGWVGWSLYGLARFETVLEEMDRRDWVAASADLEQLPKFTLPPAFLRFQQGLAHGQLALNHQSSPNLTEAIARYEEGLALTSTYLPGWANLAGLYWQAGDAAAADAALQTAIQLIGPRDPGTLYLLNLGLLQEQTGAEQAGITSYALAIAQRPALAEATFWQESGWRQSRWPAILANSRRLITQTAPASRRSLELGQLAFYSGDFDRAEAYFMEAGPASGDMEADLWRGRTLVKRGDVEAGLLLFDRLIKSPAGRVSSEAYLERGQIYLALEQPKAAERDFRLALFLGERSSHFYLGQLALQYDDVEQAITRFRQGLPATFEIQTLYRNYDFMFFRTNYWQWQVDGNLLPLKAFPPSISDMERYVALADLYVQTGEIEAAKRLYADLLLISPNLALAKEMLADLEN